MQSPGGLYIAARRNAEAGHYYWRITQWIMPWYTMVPPYGDNALNAHVFVPIDDESSFTWTFTYHPTRPLSGIELDVMRKGGGIHVMLIPGTFRGRADLCRARRASSPAPAEQAHHAEAGGKEREGGRERDL